MGRTKKTVSPNNSFKAKPFVIEKTSETVTTTSTEAKETTTATPITSSTKTNTKYKGMTAKRTYDENELSKYKQAVYNDVGTNTKVQSRPELTNRVTDFVSYEQEEPSYSNPLKSSTRKKKSEFYNENSDWLTGADADDSRPKQKTYRVKKHTNNV